MIKLPRDEKPDNWQEAIHIRSVIDGVEWYFEGDIIPSKVYASTDIYSVTPRQFRQALTIAGHRAAVEAAVAASTQDIQDWYAYSTAFDSNNPVTLGMATALGFSDTQIKDLFLMASTL